MRLTIRAWITDEDDVYPVHEIVVASEGTDAKEAMTDQILGASSTISRLLRDDLREKIWSVAEAAQQ